MRGATVTITQQLPARFDRAHVAAALRRGAITADVTEFAWARVHVYARTIAEAQSKASDSLDFYRAALNYAFVSPTWDEFTSDSAKPLNVLLLGPSYSLHEPSGHPATEMYWYEPWFRKHDPLRCGTDKWNRAHALASTMRKRIAGSRYGEDLYRIMIQYCRTLDSGDVDVVLLRLWGLLEPLTGTGFGRSDDLVKRAAALFHDSDVVRGTLEILRQRRNQIAHIGAAEQSIREDMVVLHRVVAQAIGLAFQKSGEYSSTEEIGVFLSLPSEASELRRGIKLRRDAMRFRGHQ
jgi:hypothetical protein